MRVSSQLRLAIGVLIALLAGILVVALYVPAQLEQSANDKYVNDAIPLRDLAHKLTEQVLEQDAALRGFLARPNQPDLKRYTTAQAEANSVLADMKAYTGRHPELERLL